MLVDGVIIVVVVAALLGAVLLRRRSHDDVHSVEGYHRQIHTLEGIAEHPTGPDVPEHLAAPSKHAFPESAVRLTDSTTVRLIAPPPETVPPPVVPPIVPPPGSGTSSGQAGDGKGGDGAAGAVTFDDAHPAHDAEPPAWMQDPAIGTMNRRPRQLAAPALAVAAVTVLIVVLLVYGAHPASPRHRTTPPRPAHTTTTRPVARTTTTLPNVSAPQVTSASDATYEVGERSYTLVVSATSGECWISVTGPTGAAVFSGILVPGQTKTLPASGLFSVEVGAPSSFAATVDGTAVTLPAGYQTPLTLHFTPPASAA